MGKVAHLIRRAVEAGLRNEVPTECLFLTHGDGVCLILSDGVPIEGAEGYVLLVFGEPSSPACRPPRVSLRRQLVGGSWEVCIESDDANLPPELVAFAQRNFDISNTRESYLVDGDDAFEIVFDLFVARTLWSSLACAS
jgi:hypothetical protein